MRWSSILAATAVSGVAGCSSGALSLGHLQFSVSCPPGGPTQRWTQADTATSFQSATIQSGAGGAWLAFIQAGGSARYDGVDWGTVPGWTALRVFTAVNDRLGVGGTMGVYADSASNVPIGTCTIPKTGSWFAWQVVDCGGAALTGVHSLTFTFSGPPGYLFNFDAFGLVPPGASNDCSVTGPSP